MFTLMNYFAKIFVAVESPVKVWCVSYKYTLDSCYHEVAY